MKTRTLTLITPTREGEMVRGPNDQHGRIPIATARPYCGRSLVWWFDNGSWKAELDTFYWTPITNPANELTQP